MDTNQEQGFSLVQTPPSKFKPQGTAAEMRMLEMECAFLNDPRISGDKKGELPPTSTPSSAPTVAGITPTASATGLLTPEERARGGPQSLPAAPPTAPKTPQEEPGETKGFVDPVFENAPSTPTPQLVPAAPVATPAPAAPPAPMRIILTGRTGVGKSLLASRSGAVVLELDDLIRKLAKDVLGNIADGPAADVLVDTIYNWGNGQVNNQYPLTPARMLFVQWAHVNKLDAFGQPGFYVNRLIERAQEITEQQVIVTGVTSVEDWKALMNAGFRHYHVVCSAASYASRPKRKNADDRLAAALDKDITQKLSGQRTGEKLRCIWSDGGVPHTRLFSVEQWLQAININNNPSPEGVAFE